MLDKKNTLVSVLLKQNAPTTIDCEGLCFIIQRTVTHQILPHEPCVYFIKFPLLIFFVFLSQGALHCYNIKSCELIHQLDSGLFVPACLVPSPASCVLFWRIMWTCHGAALCTSQRWRCPPAGDNNRRFVNGTPYLPGGSETGPVWQQNNTRVLRSPPTSPPPFPPTLTANRWLFSKVLCRSLELW